MAEINQPSPIKPIWPTRREPPATRRETDQKEKQSPRQRPAQRRDDGDGEHTLDDYA